MLQIWYIPIFCHFLKKEHAIIECHLLTAKFLHLDITNNEIFHETGLKSEIRDTDVKNAAVPLISTIHGTLSIAATGKQSEC